MDRSTNHESRNGSAGRARRIADAFYSTPWAILPTTLAEVERVLRTGEPFAAAQSRAARAQGSAVAVISVFGIISRRADAFSDFFGGTPIDTLTRSFRAALADSSIKAIILDVDSPGGAVAGVPELAAEIFAARGRGKSIIAVADCMAASAAYWIASAADELVAAPSSEVGSIGVYAMHLDWSKAMEMDGIAPTIIASGKYKAEANPYQPLGQEARNFMQKRVDEYGDMFLRAVAQNRGVSSTTVKESFGQGRVFGAADALSLGMVDSIGTLDAALARLGAGTASSSAHSALAHATGSRGSACVVCAGSGCVVITGEDGQPKITGTICQSCNGVGRLPAGFVDNLGDLRARQLAIEIERERFL